MPSTPPTQPDDARPRPPDDFVLGPIANPTTQHVANPTTQHVASPASLSFALVPRWRELGWLRGIFEGIAGQDQRAYNKWIENEFRMIDSLPLPLGQANDMRSAAKKKIDDHRQLSFWATAIIPTFVFINSIVVCLVG
ncbi:hypothetical protein I350_02564 [Cryptococcus amylolentus CBS 6273]|uniref:Uncharacterized protein n=1 Tax=Cryptococcus amylolentus CBS 6273 TaxID=1296118 RepID=A0A1E3KBD1_9TREE|nr:hypothetical protein I350_02564 [Cryptococcus amylolentus CBS 6273]